MTFKEAVQSGKKFRHRSWDHGIWWQAGTFGECQMLVNDKSRVEFFWQLTIRPFDTEDSWELFEPSGPGLSFREAFRTGKRFKRIKWSPKHWVQKETETSAITCGGVIWNLAHIDQDEMGFEVIE